MSRPLVQSSDETVKVLISLNDDGAADVEAVARQVATSGVAVEDVMRLAGVIAGAAPLSLLPALRRIHGVEEVREEGVFYPA
ncbi:MAG: hypothetical protein AAFV51_06940 [Pseudomonadota bacterium]